MDEVPPVTYNSNLVNLAQVPTAALQTLSAEQAFHYGALPVALDGGKLTIAIAEGTDDRAVGEEIGLLTGFEIGIAHLPNDQLSRALAGAYRRSLNNPATLHSSTNEGDSLLERIFSEAIELRSSDVHLEPGERTCRVRLRVDGALLERFVIEPKDYPRLVNQIKVRANLDISQRRLPQDGRLRLEARGLDVRVATTPTLHGEKLVLRLLGANAQHLALENLGMLPSQLTHFRLGVTRETGIILISGPTGSGKTTTLWGTLAELNAGDQNIMTVEDPIEYTLSGVNQVQANERNGLSFARALRSFLRLDPDVIMVGEIRDLETAQIAVRASTTGHLVLSTVHTSSAWGIIGRLHDMGLPRYLLADNLNTLVAQRLLRRLCDACKVPDERAGRGYRHEGCPACHYTGFHGRIAIYEVLPVTAALREAIRGNSAAPPEVKSYPTLKSEAKRLVTSGLTSAAEARAFSDLPL